MYYAVANYIVSTKSPVNCDYYDAQRKIDQTLNLGLHVLANFDR